jgi:hypothetical protein
MNYKNYQQRLEKALSQYAKHQPNKLVFSLDYLVSTILPAIISVCGPHTDTRQNMLRLGQTIISHSALKVVAPSCPDWSNNNGRYTHQGLGGNISSLARVQIDFLRALHNAGVPVHAHIVYPDQEAWDARSLEHAATDQATFLSQIKSSVLETNVEIAADRWTAGTMTELIPDFEKQEQETQRELQNNPQLSQRFFTEAMDRRKLDEKLYRDIPWEESYQRAVRRGAHYLILGNYVSQQGYALSDLIHFNHVWYKQANAGILNIPA